MNIYLIRHGETNWNKQLKIQGRIDNPLNETGKAQAEELATRFLDIKPNAIFHTSLKRAHETYQILDNILNFDLKASINDAFIERDFGSLEGQAVDEYYKTEDFSKVDGYEQDYEIKARVLEGFKNIKQDNTVIVCHSHVIKSAIILSDETKYNYSNTKLKNCCIAHFRFENDRVNLIDIF